MPLEERARRTELGRRIRRARGGARLTRPQLGELLGLVYTRIRSAEEGVAPAPEALLRWLEGRETPPLAAVALREGLEIRDSRRRAGLSQRQLGELLGVARTAVSGWERGQWRPPEEAVRWAREGG